MSEYKALYRYSLDEAIRMGERQDWWKSYFANCDCARAIDKAICDNYSGNVLHNCIQPLIDEYGFERVNWVLANTVLEKSHDGRFSAENKQWAKSFPIPNDTNNCKFIVDSHPGLVDIAINHARRAWQALHESETQEMTMGGM